MPMTQKFPAPSLPDLSVVIVNYNSTDFLWNCLESLHHETGCSHETIVVDNASTDHGIQGIPEAFPSVRFIMNPQNRGFGPANNQALAQCRGRFVFFLNPDTKVTPGALSAIVRFLDENPHIGLAGTRLVHPDGSPQGSFDRRYPGHRRGRRDLGHLPGDIAWVLGAAMAARRKVLEKADGFDERFFLYGEEQDLCLRIRKAGWSLAVIPEAVVIHWGGQSERENTPAAVWCKKFAAEQLFYETHYSRKTAKALRRDNLLQSAWRIFSLRLSLPFIRNKNAARKKLAKYRTVWSMYQGWRGRKESSQA